MLLLFYNFLCDNIFMKLLEKFEKNLIFPDKKYDRLVESAISKLFFYGDKVCKVYKNEKYFFGDFRNSSFRNKFYREDFDWNRTLSPTIYKKLVSVDNDFYILMKNVNTEKSLFNLLQKKKVKRDQLCRFIKDITRKIDFLTKKKNRQLKNISSLGLYKILMQDVSDLVPWSAMAAPALPISISKKFIDSLKTAIKDEKYFRNFRKNKITASPDNHSGNIILISDKYAPIDVMPPKPSWRVCDPYANICRPAVDAAVLQSEKLADSMYQTYESIKPSVPPRVKTIYELRSALIMLPYMYVLDKPSLGKKYLRFIEQRIKNL